MNQLSLSHGRYSSELFTARVNASSSKLSWILLAQVALCVVPAMGLVALGNPYTGARWFFTILLLLLTRFLLMKNRLGFVSLLVSSIPPPDVTAGIFLLQRVDCPSGNGDCFMVYRVSKGVLTIIERCEI